jgi:ribosomal protein S18 acetylase RimI-like enzyme
MAEITIVKAGKEDIPFLAEYRYRMFCEMDEAVDYSQKKERFCAAARQYYADYLDAPDEASYCAHCGSETIACGTIVFQRRPPHLKHKVGTTAYILNIYVRPDFRKQGLATRIMEALREEARARGVKKIGLHASRFGLPLYKKLGYVVKENYLELELEP